MNDILLIFMLPYLFILSYDSKWSFLYTLISFGLALLIIFSFIYLPENRGLNAVILGAVLLPVFFAWIYRTIPTEICLEGDLENSPVDFLYFSYTTYNTLGYGDIRPVGNCRLITSIQSMIGMIFVAYLAVLFYRGFEPRNDP